MEQDGKNVNTGFQLFAVNLLEKLVNGLKGFMTEGFLDFCSRWLYTIGHFGIIAAAGVGFLFCFILAIKTNLFTAFLYGIGWVLIIFVAQYTAHKFSAAGEKLIQNNPTTLASKTFLDCIGFLGVIGGLVVLIVAIVNSIQYKDLNMFLAGLAAAIFMEFVALISFNPQSITISIVEDNSAGQEAIGIITFSLKVFMKMVPILFGAGIAIGTIMLFITMFDLFGDGARYAMPAAAENATFILFAALLPFLSYIFFALCYLIVDIWKAILSLPGKLDKLDKRQ